MLNLDKNQLNVYYAENKLSAILITNKESNIELLQNLLDMMGHQNEIIYNDNIIIIDVSHNPYYNEFDNTDYENIVENFKYELEKLNK